MNRQRELFAFLSNSICTDLWAIAAIALWVVGSGLFWVALTIMILNFIASGIRWEQTG